MNCQDIIIEILELPIKMEIYKTKFIRNDKPLYDPYELYIVYSNNKVIFEDCRQYIDELKNSIVEKGWNVKFFYDKFYIDSYINAKSNGELIETIYRPV